MPLHIADPEGLHHALRVRAAQTSVSADPATDGDAIECNQLRESPDLVCCYRTNPTHFVLTCQETPSSQHNNPRLVETKSLGDSDQHET